MAGMRTGTINTPKKPAVLLCPVCGCRLAPNKGWAAQFYEGYCSRCDMPVETEIEYRAVRQNKLKIKNKNERMKLKNGY